MFANCPSNQYAFDEQFANSQVPPMSQSDIGSEMPMTTTCVKDASSQCEREAVGPTNAEIMVVLQNLASNVSCILQKCDDLAGETGELRTCVSSAISRDRTWFAKQFHDAKQFCGQKFHELDKQSNQLSTSMRSLDVKVSAFESEVTRLQPSRVTVLMSETKSTTRQLVSTVTSSTKRKYVALGDSDCESIVNVNVEADDSALASGNRLLSANSKYSLWDEASEVVAPLSSRPLSIVEQETDIEDEEPALPVVPVASVSNKKRMVQRQPATRETQNTSNIFVRTTRSSGADDLWMSI
jgi:hypothetical protein